MSAKTFVLGALACGVTLGAARGQEAQPTPDSWIPVWRELEAIEALATDAEAQAARRAALYEALLDRCAQDEDVRCGVASKFLAQITGARFVDLEELDTAGPLPALDPEAAWFAARVWDPGPERSKAFALALAALPEEQYDARIGIAFEAFREEATALRLASALTLGEAMHARAQAPWSAQSLAHLRRRMGEYEAADELLRLSLERTSEPAQRLQLIEARALVALGAGWEERARDQLGIALAKGSRDAYQILGRIALAEDRPERARALFAALLGPPHAASEPQSEAPEPPPWALRGWGLALLPPAPDPKGAAADTSVGERAQVSDPASSED